MSRPGSRILSVVAAVALLGALSSPALAEDPLRVRITQVDASAFPDVRVVASVVDTQDRPVTDLASQDFIVSEDGHPQAASTVPALQTTPVAVALVLDTSGSMAGRPLVDAKTAMAQLIRSLGAADQAAVLTFNTSVAIPAPLTTDKDALVAATNGAVAGGNKAIFDAVAKAIDVLSAAGPQARRAVVLLTDGIDNSSTTGRSAVLDRVRAQGYPLYVVGLGSDLDRATLQALADASRGGQAFVAPTSAQLASIYTAVSARLATQYLVTYRSDAPSAAEGAELKLTLQVVRAGTALGTGTTSFTVPAGRAVVPNAAARGLPALPGQDRYPPELVGALGAATALTLVLWAFGVMGRRQLGAIERRRVGELVGSDTGESRDRRTVRSFRERALMPILSGIGRRSSRLSPSGMAERTELRLAQAGGPLDLGPVDFLGLQLAAVVTGASLFAAVGLFTLGLDLGWLLLVALAGAILGILIPNIWLDRSTKARQRRILRALPSALDMLALSARAGLTFDGAIAQVVLRWESPLSDEFRRVLADFRIGRDRRDTLRAMASRTGVPDVARFANAVIQADSLGVPISKVLFDQAIEMRTRRRQRAEEAARTAPIKMLFPMVGLIFPALFLVILGPAVPRFIELFAAH